MCSNNNVESDEKIKGFVCTRLHHKVGHWGEITKPVVAGLVLEQETFEISQACELGPALREAALLLSASKLAWPCRE